LNKLPKYKVFEQAFSKKKFEDKATDLSVQINKHIMKCLYCRYYDTDNININHWKSEIGSWLGWFMDAELKVNAKKSKLLWNNIIDGYNYQTFEKYKRKWDWYFNNKKYSDHSLKYQPLTEEIHDFYLKTMKELFSSIDNENENQLLDIIDNI